MGDRLSDLDELNRHLGQVKQHAAELVATVKKMGEVSRVLQQRADRAECVVQEATEILPRIHSSLADVQTYTSGVQRETEKVLRGLQDRGRRLVLEMQDAHQNQLARQEEAGHILLEQLESKGKKITNLIDEVSRDVTKKLADIDTVKSDLKQVLEGLSASVESKANEALVGAQREWHNWQTDFEGEHLRRTELMVQTVKVQDQWVRGVIETQRQQIATLESWAKASATKLEDIALRLEGLEHVLPQLVTVSTLRDHESTVIQLFAQHESNLAATRSELSRNAVQLAEGLRALDEQNRKSLEKLTSATQDIEMANRTLARRLQIVTWVGGILAFMLFVIAMVS